MTSTACSTPRRLPWAAWRQLKAWWWGFIGANAALAGLLFHGVRDKEFFAGVHPWLAGLLAGAGYTALVRLKFTTLPNNTPFGLESFYEGLKALVHKRINQIVREWRVEQIKSLVQSDLAALRQQALLTVDGDALLTAQEGQADRAYIEQTAGDQGTPEVDRRRALATFIIKKG